MSVPIILFLAWQDPVGRRWFTIGRLEHREGVYKFEYTRGAKEAENYGFQPLVAFPNLERVYESESVFPLFSNRLLSPQRPEYEDYINWISISKENPEPIAILARTGGSSETDTLEMFPCPEPVDGLYKFYFFVRGLRHQLQASSERATQLEQDEKLLLMSDLQNPFDEMAIALRTSERTRRDMHLMGYLPRYLANELNKFQVDELRKAVVRIVRVNPPPAPIHFRVLCKMEMRWPDGYLLFDDKSFEPISNGQPG